MAAATVQRRSDQDIQMQDLHREQDQAKPEVHNQQPQQEATAKQVEANLPQAPQSVADWEKVLPQAQDAGTMVNLHFGSRVAKKDADGPVLDSSGKPETEWRDADIKSQQKWEATKVASGEDPSLVYGDTAHGSFAAGPEADAVVAAIRTARGAIPPRKMGRSPNNNAGWDHDPSSRPAKHEADAGSQEYNKWLKAQEGNTAPEGIDPRLWKVYQQIQHLEGQPTRVTTFDQTLSVGAGFSTSGGLAQQILGATLKRLPELAETVRATGFWVTPSGSITVVDPDKKWILSGKDAINYINASPELLSLIVDVIEGSMPTAPNQAVGADEADRERSEALRAQFDVLRQHALSDELTKPRADGTAIIDWPDNQRILAVHANHGYPGLFPYSFWDTHPHSSAAEVGEQIYLNAPEATADTIVEATDFMSVGEARPQYRRDKSSAASARRKANVAYQAAKAPELAAEAAEKAAAAAEARAQADNAPASAAADATAKRAKATELRARADADPRLADATALVAEADAATKNARLEECDFLVRKDDIKITKAQRRADEAKAALEKLGEKSSGLSTAQAKVAAEEKALAKLTDERDTLAKEAAGLRDSDAVGAAQRTASRLRRLATAVKAEADAASADKTAHNLADKARRARALADKAAGTKNEARLVAAAEAAERAEQDARDKADTATAEAAKLRAQVDQTNEAPASP